MKVLLAVVVAVGLASVAATLWIGGRTMERTVVSDPYEHGLHYDGERHGRERLGWRARFEPGALRPGGAVLPFALVDAAGRPLEGASVQVALARPAGGGDERRAPAQALGGGRYQAPLGFAAPGFWDVRLDVSRGPDQAGLVQQVRVEAPAAEGAPCRLGATPCAAGDLALSLDLGPAPATMKELPAAVEVRRAGAPLDGAVVEVSLAMKDMEMGENRVALAPAGAGRYAGRAVLVRCHSGRRDWIATVTVRVAGAAPVSAAFPFAVVE